MNLCRRHSWIADATNVKTGTCLMWNIEVFLKLGLAAGRAQTLKINICLS